MLWYSQTYEYDCEWPVVSLAFLLRYPNPYAAHVLSCDVIDRTWSPTGTLCTTRLILKRGALPRWFPSGVLSRAESWIIEESEVDPFGKTLRCTTRNLDHVKVMQVCESTVLQSGANGKTSQYTEARVMSNFGWGLAKRIENHGLAKFKANIQRSREGVSLVLSLLRQSRMHATMGGPGPDTSFSPSLSQLQNRYVHSHLNVTHADSPPTPSSDGSFEPHDHQSVTRPGVLVRLKSWFGRS
ncbi:PRELI-like family-domain-containing protein [Pterulicium gracile]|uniref:PRELI-like family-domain-containing protein n=1 Tax=Pterulicium gracile TaxID=1884261 RepID=A0A5C3QP30_9AGAR|nr:PRELI-like family-domain-containing protein [Pterula gracilis]